MELKWWEPLEAPTPLSPLVALVVQEWKHWVVFPKGPHLRRQILEAEPLETELRALFAAMGLDFAQFLNQLPLTSDRMLYYFEATLEQIKKHLALFNDDDDEAREVIDNAKRLALNMQSFFGFSKKAEQKAGLERVVATPQVMLSLLPYLNILRPLNGVSDHLDRVPSFGDFMLHGMAAENVALAPILAEYMLLELLTDMDIRNFQTAAADDASPPFYFDEFERAAYLQGMAKEREVVRATDCRLAYIKNLMTPYGPDLETSLNILQIDVEKKQTIQELFDFLEFPPVAEDALEIILQQNILSYLAQSHARVHAFFPFERQRPILWNENVMKREDVNRKLAMACDSLARTMWQGVDDESDRKQELRLLFWQHLLKSDHYAVKLARDLTLAHMHAIFVLQVVHAKDPEADVAAININTKIMEIAAYIQTEFVTLPLNGVFLAAMKYYYEAMSILVQTVEQEAQFATLVSTVRYSEADSNKRPLESPEQMPVKRQRVLDPSVEQAMLAQQRLVEVDVTTSMLPITRSPAYQELSMGTQDWDVPPSLPFDWPDETAEKEEEEVVILPPKPKPAAPSFVIKLRPVVVPRPVEVEEEEEEEEVVILPPKPVRAQDRINTLAGRKATETVLLADNIAHIKNGYAPIGSNAVGADIHGKDDYLDKSYSWTQLLGHPSLDADYITRALTVWNEMNEPYPILPKKGPASAIDAKLKTLETTADYEQALMETYTMRQYIQCVCAPDRAPDPYVIRCDDTALYHLSANDRLDRGEEELLATVKFYLDAPFHIYNWERNTIKSLRGADRIIFRVKRITEKMADVLLELNQPNSKFRNWLRNALGRLPQYRADLGNKARLLAATYAHSDPAALDAEFDQLVQKRKEFVFFYNRRYMTLRTYYMIWQEALGLGLNAQRRVIVID